MDIVSAYENTTSHNSFLTVPTVSSSHVQFENLKGVSCQRYFVFCRNWLKLYELVMEDYNRGVQNQQRWKSKVAAQHAISHTMKRKDSKNINLYTNNYTTDQI